MAYKNPADSKAYKARWYVANKAHHIANVRRNTVTQRKLVREYLLAYLRMHPCVDCGETDVVVLDFDHVRGQKLSEISDMMRKGYKLEKIVREIEKCEVVCANDHRRRTAKRALHFKHIAQNTPVAQSQSSRP